MYFVYLYVSSMCYELDLCDTLEEYNGMQYWVSHVLVSKQFHEVQ